MVGDRRNIPTQPPDTAPPRPHVSKKPEEKIVLGDLSL